MNGWFFLNLKYHFLVFQLTFFGLTDAYALGVYEQLFFLKQHGGWSFIEAYNLPVGLRTWFLEKLKDQIEKENEALK